MPEVIEAIGNLLNWSTVIYMVAGVIVGIIVGAIPGLTGAMAISLMLPLTFALPLSSSLGLIIGTYKGAIFGASIPAIAFSTPGSGAAIATIADGFELTKQGKTGKALKMSLLASLSGDTMSDIITILALVPVAAVALRFGPSELSVLMFLSLLLIGTLSGKSIRRGLQAAFLGLIAGAIGEDPIVATDRLIFGIETLREGFPLIPVLIGLFAVSEVLYQLVSLPKGTKSNLEEMKSTFFRKTLPGGDKLTMAEIRECLPAVFKGTFVGTIVGILPGLGSAVGATLSYAVAKQTSRRPNLFGRGALEGVAAAEAGNNATCGPTLVPLLAFGVPGSIDAALVGAALLLHGIATGPLIFERNPVEVYTLLVILIAANIPNLLIGYVFVHVYTVLSKVTAVILFPAVVVLASLGSYAVDQSSTGMFVAVGFGIVGFVMRRYDIPRMPFVIAFLIGPLLEANVRRALLTRGGNPLVFLQSTTNLIMVLSVICLGILIGVLRRYVAKHKGNRVESPSKVIKG